VPEKVVHLDLDLISTDVSTAGGACSAAASFRALVLTTAASSDRDAERDPDEPPARRSHARTIGHAVPDEHRLPARGENPAT
jgi:hypothetical protein